MFGAVKDTHPELQKLYPLVITDTFDATRAFYLERLGAQITFDMPNYLQVRFGEAASAPELAFMRAETEFTPPGGSFSGQGIVISVPVASADAHAQSLTDRGVKLAEPPTDRPWQWRSFHVRDPSGVVLDFFHPVADG